MITRNLIKALEEIGFTYVEGSSSDASHAYAVYGNYMVSAYEESGKKIAYFNFKLTENEENDLKKYDMSETFSEYMEEFEISDYSIDEDGMRVTCKGNIPVFLKLIDKCIELLIDNEIKGVDYCSICGNKFGSRKPKKVTYITENYIMCEHCALEAVEESKKPVNDVQEENTNKTGLSILFSTLFAAIGAAVYFVLYYWLSPAISATGLNEMSYVFCAGGFIVATLAYFGYKMFSKKGGICAYTTVVANAVIFTAIGQYIGVVFEFIAKKGFSLSALTNKHFWLLHIRNTIPENVSTQFTNYSGTFWKLLIISIMFAVVGSAIYLLSLHEKSVKKPQTVEVETISIS